MKTLILLSFALFLSSCATSYQPKGLSGGYSDQRLSRDMFKVSFVGNGYTGSETVQRYLLRRCAELTIENGYTHFVMINGSRDTGTSYVSSFNGYASGNQFSGYGSTYAVNRHSGEAIIKMLNDPAPEVLAYDAEMIFGRPNKRESASLPKSSEIDSIEH